MRYFVITLLVLQGVAVAGDPKITPTQKTTVYNEPVQKTPAPTVVNSPTQKTTTYNTPVQKGTGTAMSDVPIPDELLDALKRLQPKAGEPGKNLGRALARCIVKKKIANFVQDNLPPLPLP